jgi:hypothetical protein
VNNYLEVFDPGDQFLVGMPQANQLAQVENTEVTLCTLMYLGDQSLKDMYITVYKVKYLGGTGRYRWANNARKLFAKVGHGEVSIATAGPKTTSTLMPGIIANLKGVVDNRKILFKRCIVFDHELGIPYYAYVYKTVPTGDQWEVVQDVKQ